nr:antibiotic biosynthesis monooxygenase family protein [Streptomyces sp. CB09001]
MIVLVNVFEINDSEENFERAFCAVSEVMRRQGGFGRHRLVRSESTPTTYINVAEWTDERSLRAALAHPEVSRRVRTLMRSATAVPQICRPVLDASRQEA